MQSASTHPEEFAQVFIDCDFLTQYTLYCTGYSKSNKCLEQTLAAECDMKEFIAVSWSSLEHTVKLWEFFCRTAIKNNLSKQLAGARPPNIMLGWWSYDRYRNRMW